MREELAFWTMASEQAELPITESMAKHIVETDVSDFTYGIYFNGHIVSERRTIAEHINLAELRVL